jgi:glycine hydroxymethyltransferase
MPLVKSRAASARACVEWLHEHHGSYRRDTLNLIASENAISPAVARLLAGDLEGRYADYVGRDLTARKYRGGQHVVELEQLCGDLACELFEAEACELRPLSGHVAGSAVLMGLCRPGDLVLEVGSDGGGHRLGAKLAEARLIDLRVEFLPFDADTFTVDAPAAAEAIRTRRPALVILGSSSFLHPHPVAHLAAACRDVGAVLAFDASHVLGLIAGGRFQDPLREGAQVMFASTHKTLFGPQGGIVLGEEPVVADVSAAVYPPLVTNHHPFRLPALAVALCEHAQFGRDYADAVIANANAFLGAATSAGLDTVQPTTDSHTVLIATRGRPGAEAAASLEENGIICNHTRLPESLGVEGLRFGLQELTRRGGDERDAATAGELVARALRGASTSDGARELARRLDRIAFTWQAE